MIIEWRGWGIWVGILFVFWFFAAIAYAVVVMPYIPDPHKAVMDIQWGAAGIFLLYALSVRAVVEARRRNIKLVPHPSGASVQSLLRSDEFIWIKLVHWPAVLLAVALFFAIATSLGYEIFK